ncbi:flagellar basal body rod protein FlgF [Rhizorhabdus histidinilytica]|jgi:flagellar basal-body rod protein FlgF|uniref:Flagellar basal-body rod protein FlgF n=1 Tax=Rhizorhabdus histidinilytica TaxID=439228 RepID=A0A1T5BZL3_9SPHN|nr:flagellar basal body rod protein FlgF [Rhizorhabdus histidinilytica]QEH77394.1 flagellar basal body rod protein FlgF [Sphingomonas sp. C8-2]SKB52576.1 flagellar basal-body rod protein FlgF [Rhizorhabdus histidinilytica]
MDKLIYSSLSAMRSAMARQTMTANNLANANTVGFRGEMSSSTALWLKGDGFDSRATNSGEVTSADMSEGTINETGRDLDVALQGKDTLLAVQSREGDEAYTRRGDLQIGDSGLLTTGDGMPVLGDGGPITLPPYDKLVIAGDGTISIVPQGGDPTQMQIVDRLKLVSTNGSAVAKGLDGLFRPLSGGTLGADPQAAVRQGAIEGSNVNVSTTLIDMIEASRDWDMQVKMMSSAQDIDKASADLMRFD